MKHIKTYNESKFDNLGSLADEFRYFENSELEEGKTYLQLTNDGSLAFVKVSKYRGEFYTSHPLHYKATSVKLIEADKVYGREVEGKNSNGTFRGVLTPVNLPVDNWGSDIYDPMFRSCFVRWNQGQRNVPGGWVDIMSLKFI